MNKTISVIIPAYNAERFLAKTLEYEPEELQENILERQSD